MLSDNTGLTETLKGEVEVGRGTFYLK